MEMLYNSTRGGEKGITSSMAILKGIADDGGLFMPDHFPKLQKKLSELAGMTYQETAKVLGISSAAVNKHITRSLAKIRETLKIANR